MDMIRQCEWSISQVGAVIVYAVYCLSTQSLLQGKLVMMRDAKEGMK